MKVKMDRSGRIVIPKELRERVGLTPGELELSEDGAGLRIDPPVSEAPLVRQGRFLTVATPIPLTDDDIRALKEADQR